jgi:hypothetical protein
MKRVLLAATIAAFGFASMAQASSTGSTDGSATPAATQPSATPNKLATTTSAHDPNRKICKTIVPTGSRLGGRKVCQTAEEWEHLSESGRQSLDDNMTRSRERSPPGG